MKRMMTVVIIGLSSLVVHHADTVAAQTLLAKNTSKYLSNGQWEWTIFVSANAEVVGTIASVEYRLHPTFPNPIQKVTLLGNPERPFGLTAIGWGVFEVGITVTFRDGRLMRLTHMLVFDAGRRDPCTPSISVSRQRYQAISDDRFNGLYVYFGEITLAAFELNSGGVMEPGKPYRVNIVLFTADSRSMGPSGQIKDFKPQRYNDIWTLDVPPSEQRSIQFEYDGLPFLLRAQRPPSSPSTVSVMVCER